MTVQDTSVVKWLLVGNSRAGPRRPMSNWKANLAVWEKFYVLCPKPPNLHTVSPTRCSTRLFSIGGADLMKRGMHRLDLFKFFFV